MGKVLVKCKNCGDPFTARTADVKRGWGKFCSKSCKAIKQEQRTGQHAAHKARTNDRLWGEPEDLSWDAHKF